jgi:competence protein ComEC
VLWPSQDGPVEAGADPNDRAIVAEARIGRVRILLTSDAESAVLSALDLAPVDVLKVSHHGSADPGLARLLERLRPRVAAIEVGAGNTYGHPVPATIRTLRASGAVVYRTDRDGSVRLEERGGALTVTRHA